MSLPLYPPGTPPRPHKAYQCTATRSQPEQGELSRSHRAAQERSEAL